MTHYISRVGGVVGTVVDSYSKVVVLAAEMQGLHGAIIWIEGAEKKISGETGGSLDEALDQRPLDGGR